MTSRINDLLIRSFLLLVIFSLASYAESPCRSEWTKKIVPGIVYQHIKKTMPGGYLHIHIIRIDLNNRKISVKPELAKGTIGSLERTSRMARRCNAIAAINGSFFEARKKLHLPVGFMIIDGEVVNKSILERTTVGITAAKKVIFGIPKIKGYALNLENKKSVPIWGVNRPRKKDEVVVFTDEYGGCTRTNKAGKELVVDASGIVTEISSGDSSIPKDGFVVSLHGWSKDFASKTRVGDRLGLIYDLADQWKDVQQAITGGPLLVRDGQAIHGESIKSEKFTGDILPPNSRTALGVTKDGELLFVVVDGRYPLSIGVTYDDLAEIMKEAGADNAVGLDGGHASTMYVDGQVVNYPMNGYEAPVSNALLVTYDGWKLASAMRKVLTYIYVYKPPSQDLVDALIKGADMSPTAYVPRPEDYGMWGLYDIYNRVIKPVVPVFYVPQLTGTLEAER